GGGPDEGTSVIDETEHEAVRSEEPAAPPVKIFINYRRADTQPHALLLYRDLVPKYGAENIFFDRVNLEQQTGKQWLDEIKANANASGVFLALIGPRWSSIIAAKEGGEDDIVKVEIETALAGDDITVVPVLIDGHTPDATKLPPSLARLAGAQGDPVQQDRW